MVAVPGIVRRNLMKPPGIERIVPNCASWQQQVSLPRDISQPDAKMVPATNRRLAYARKS